MTPRFNVGDKVTIPGVLGVCTLKSWPEMNDGHFVWEQLNDAGDIGLMRTDFYSEDADGNVNPASVVPVLADTPTAPIFTDADVKDAFNAAPEKNTEETLADPVDGQEDLPVSDPADADADA